MSDAAVEFKPNLEKLKKLQQSASSVVIGGKVRELFILISNNESKCVCSNLKRWLTWCLKLARFFGLHKNTL